jgi:hypothetical protein
VAHLFSDHNLVWRKVELVATTSELLKVVVLSCEASVG